MVRRPWPGFARDRLRAPPNPAARSTAGGKAGSGGLARRQVPRDVVRGLVMFQGIRVALTVGQDLLAAVLVAYTVYLGILEVGGFLRPDRVPPSAPRRRLAVLIPAHNEALVIASLVDSLWQVDYPRQLYDVFVVADNCSDATAQTARAAGATVFERRSRRRGKGYALSFGWRQIRRRGEYDAIVVVDADNLVAANLLQQFNDHLQAGHAIIQCRKQSKNPVDNGVTALKTLVLWTSDRFIYAPKTRLGLSSVLLGSGMCISTEVLRRLGWRCFCLTEDFEFTAQAVLAGYRVHWADDTMIYEEQPATCRAAVRQHVRWARGQHQVFFRYGARLFVSGVVHRDLRRIEAAAQTAQSLIPIIGTVVAVLGWLVWNLTGHVPLWNRIPYWLWMAVLVVQALMPLPAYRQYPRADARPFWWIWLYPVLLSGLVGIAGYALLTVRHGRWDVTPHGRAITVGELGSLRPSVGDSRGGTAERQSTGTGT